MGIFDENDGKPTVEKDFWGNEYVQNRDNDGNKNGHITKETDDLGVRTGKLGGDYNRHYDKDDNYVGYSFDEGHGRTRYVEKYVDTDSYKNPSSSTGSQKSSSSSSASNSNSYQGGSYSSGSDYSSSSSESGPSFGLGFIILIICLLVLSSFKSNEEMQEIYKTIVIFFEIVTVMTITITASAIIYILMYRTDVFFEREKLNPSDKFYWIKERKLKNPKHQDRRFWITFLLIILVFTFYVGAIVKITTPKNEEKPLEKVVVQENEPDPKIVHFTTLPNGKGFYRYTE